MRRPLALIAVALAAAGCMGDDGDGGSLEDYVARADGVCGTYQVRLSRIPRPATADPTELASYLERALPIAREQHEELSKLEKPAGEDGEQIDRLLVLLDEELDFNETAQEAASSGNRETLDTALSQGAAVSAEAGQLAERLGFVVCARRA